ncbi:MAG TPA: TonB family protein [Myxococcaceae bacterium]
MRTPLEVQRPADPPARETSEARNEVPGRDEPGTGDGKGPGGPGGGPECATPPCGDGGGVFSEDVVAAMPEPLEAPEVRLSQEAVRSGVVGTMLVRCVITAAGTVEGCEVLKGVPLAEAAVLAALQGRHYRPAQIQGRAVSVRHLFTIWINPPR